MFQVVSLDNDIYHHGIKGQKWGVRRWQNEDGSLTAAGREHYNQTGHNRSLSYRVGEKRLTNRVDKFDKRMTSDLASTKRTRQENVALLGTARSETEAALQQPNRVSEVGSRTILQRTLASVTGLAASGASVITAYGLETTMPLVGIPAAAIAAGMYWVKTKS